MGRLNTILSFIRTARNGAKVTDVKCNPGGGANVTAEHFSAPGDDAFPLDSDVALTVPVTGSGREAAVGYLDPVNTPTAAKGEKRIYSRDSSGAVVAEVWLKNDGAVTINNELGSIELLADGTITQTTGIGSLVMTALGVATLTNGFGTFIMLADGSFSINGLIITPVGVMISALGVNSDTHAHAQDADSAGDTQVNTGVPIV